MPETIVSLVPNVTDLLALDVEDLAGVIFEALPSMLQNGAVHIQAIATSPFPQLGPSYPHGTRGPVGHAISEAVVWLEVQGLIFQDPGQHSWGWYRISRRGAGVQGRAGVAAYKAAHVLPADLMHPALARVRPQFLRGDYDVAVFQAFKIVEVQVRHAANAKGAGYPDDLVGVPLMRKGFHIDTGPLTDKELVPAEREAMQALFAGAIGHAKNPNGHRDVAVKAETAARLIIFASHLLDLVDERTAVPA
jgi:uncharacterized protein (TIGR02391 family)